MKIQLIEAFHGGHHTNYIEALLPTFRRNLESGHVSEVTITVTKTHHEQLLRQGIAKQEAVNLRFLPTFPDINPNPSLQDRYKLFQSINQSVEEVNADALICTSADYDVMFSALLKSNASYGARQGCKSVGVFHYGYPRSKNLAWKENLKQKIYETAWKNAAWDRFLFVNPLMYEYIKQQNSTFSGKTTLLPDPVPAAISVETIEARKRLGIPQDGFYLGFVGMMDTRKAIPELLAAFVHAKAHLSSRLLLAGMLAQEYHQLIQEKYADLVKSQRIVLINRHLSNDEVQLGYAAIDAQALLQYRRINLSANLLKAVAYGKPILVDNYGYTGMMTNRFGLGSSCDVHNIDSISHAMTHLIETAKNFKQTPQTKRLIEFHHVDNYANTIMAQLISNNEPDSKLRTWEWVCEGLVDL